MYVKRVVDEELAKRLAASGAVLIEGMKACGKTETARQVARHEFRFDVDHSARALVAASPQTIFEQTPPILLDEWQIAPALWDLVRRDVDDHSPERGRIILTGSATPNPNSRRHSGAGRISILRMRPMSLYETGTSTGDVSLQQLFDGASPSAIDPGVTVPKLIDALIIGGWPALIGATTRDAQMWIQDYLQNLIEVDIQQLGGRRDPRNVRRLLSALGRAVGTEAAITTLAADIGGADGSVDRGTVSTYLAALERLMIVENLEAWAPHMRSATPLRKAEKRYLADPSLGVGALGIGSAGLLSDLNAAGFHFEGLVVRDVRVYVQGLGGHVHHWRDNNAHEVDLIVSLLDGRWGAFEVKMNPDDVHSAAAGLLRFAAKVDQSRVGAPAFLGVITTNTSSYRRDDGVLVVAISALGP